MTFTFTEEATPECISNWIKGGRTRTYRRRRVAPLRNAVGGAHFHAKRVLLVRLQAPDSRAEVQRIA